MSDPPSKTEKPRYLGHRRRLRERLQKGGGRPSLEEAQREIATDWIAACRKRLGDP